MKHYVVTRGCYSDYRIVAVCADKSAAEKIAERINRESFVDLGDEELNYISDECGIEEYEDGEVLYKESLNPYFVNFDKGVVEEDETELAMREHTIEFKSGHILGMNGHILGMSVFAKDKQEAWKIASEKRAMLMAQKEGI